MIRPFGWNEFLFILTAVQWTLALSAIAFFGGGIGGLTIALMRTSSMKLLRGITTAYIRLFQGTPLLMQLFLVYFGANIFGLPLNAWIAALLALSLHASAFLGEIWRGCIQAVAPRVLAVTSLPPCPCGFSNSILISPLMSCRCPALSA